MTIEIFIGLFVGFNLRIPLEKNKTEIPLNKKILRLAIPNIISNLSVPLLGVVDTAVLGHLDEIYYLGALAVGGIIFNFIYWGFGFLRMGTTGLTAQAYGTKDDAQR